jgi:AcrR family transcriptional regulator
MYTAFKKKENFMEEKKSEHMTAQKILRAAEQVFMAKGFEGSSINEIAGKAKVHKSLIYHHFGSKEGLWKAVKTDLLEAHSGKEISRLGFPMDSFKDFLKSFIILRFEFYDKNPEIARLILWQRLEKVAEEIKGVQDERLNTIAPQIKEFQDRGEIRSDLDPDMVSYIIMKTASLPFMEQPDFFKGPDAQQNKQKFLEMIIESLYLAFSLRNSPRIWSI